MHTMVGVRRGRVLDEPWVRAMGNASSLLPLLPFLVHLPPTSREIPRHSSGSRGPAWLCLSLAGDLDKASSSGLGLYHHYRLVGGAAAL